VTIPRSVRIGFAALVILLGTVLSIVLWQPVWLLHRQELKTGNEIVVRVESFRKGHAHLPETLKDVGMDEENLNVFYRRISNDEYIVWFGIGVGESETYNSRTKKWE